MNFKERIEPFLRTEDVLLQDFVGYALHDYPNVDRSWTEELINKAVKNRGAAALLSIDPEHEEIVGSLVEGVKNIPYDKVGGYYTMISDLSPEIALKYRQDLAPYLSKDMWVLYELLVHGTKEEVFEEYEIILDKLEAEKYIHSGFYKMAKKIAYTLVKKQWVTDALLEKDLQDNLKEEWFNYRGILTVYMIGLLKKDKYIQDLAPLLVRDEDILLEEVSAALIAFQTDEVVEAVAPYLLKPESSIFAASIVENIKSDYAVEVLKDAYHQVEDEDSQVMIVEALAHQLSPAAEPEINEFVSKRPFSYLIDVDLMAYGYYKIRGIDHPLLGEWEMKVKNSENERLLRQKELESMSKNVKKVGRNDPCPCGSGKKYKKCCL
ncbi:SEC-C metal-binding domain-containing protein [uncultured Metabacillus sp.]|uniref:YecA family protein n=1 Tax=uncultured Metabacillus sp. TaxID=2860135 RepID=UPI0026261288|nr:SEC-C metal-binding domain-containing protein [uncultured Metabacillus sp.]